jgi:hypothetical protein
LRPCPTLWPTAPSVRRAGHPENTLRNGFDIRN